MSPHSDHRTYAIRGGVWSGRLSTSVRSPPGVRAAAWARSDAGAAPVSVVEDRLGFAGQDLGDRLPVRAGNRSGRGTAPRAASGSVKASASLDARASCRSRSASARCDDRGLGLALRFGQRLGSVGSALVDPPLAIALGPRDVAIGVDDRQGRMNVLERRCREPRSPSSIGVSRSWSSRRRPASASCRAAGQERRSSGRPTRHRGRPTRPAAGGAFRIGDFKNETAKRPGSAGRSELKGRRELESGRRRSGTVHSSSARSPDRRYAVAGLPAQRLAACSPAPRAKPDLEARGPGRARAA